MRISDWSSDVCSSDLLEIAQGLETDSSDLLEITHRSDAVHDGAEDHRRDHHLDQCDKPVAQGLHGGASLGKPPPGAGPNPAGKEHLTSEERRVGNECVRPSRSRRSPDHENKTYPESYTSVHLAK